MSGPTCVEGGRSSNFFGTTSRPFKFGFRMKLQSPLSLNRHIVLPPIVLDHPPSSSRARYCPVSPLVLAFEIYIRIGGQRPGTKADYLLDWAKSILLEVIRRPFLLYLKEVSEICGWRVSSGFWLC